MPGRRAIVADSSAIAAGPRASRRSTISMLGGSGLSPISRTRSATSGISRANRCSASSFVTTVTVLTGGSRRIVSAVSRTWSGEASTET